MSIRRRKKTQAFTQINNAALRNPALSLKAKGLLAIMMSCPEDWKFYMDWLQKQSKDGREAHQNAVKELEQHRYVVRLRVQRKDGTFKGWEYLVDDEPINDIDPAIPIIDENSESSEISQEPTNGKPVNRLATDERENRLTGKPIDGKPATTNTELTKKDLTNSGVLPVIENARASANAQPSTQPVVTTQAPHTTTVKAAPKTAPEPVAPLTPPVAVLSPDGEAAHAALADLDLSDQDFDELFQKPVVNPATSPEKIPPAAPSAADAPRRPEMAPTRPSMEKLVPVPQEELLSRFPALPGSETYRALSPLVGGEHKMTELLEQLTPSGGLDRELWLRLLPTEVETAKVAAQSGAQAGQGNMITLSIRALDRLIGAPVGRATSKAETITLPGAYMTAEERKAITAALIEVPEGSFWKCLKTGDKFEVWSVSDIYITLSNELYVRHEDFHQLYEQVPK